MNQTNMFLTTKTMLLLLYEIRFDKKLNVKLKESIYIVIPKHVQLNSADNRRVGTQIMYDHQCSPCKCTHFY